MSKKKAPAVYQLTVNERQLRLINAALEEYFRLGLNQWWGLADRLAAIGLELPPADDPSHDRVFDRYIHKRDDARIILEAVGRILWPQGMATQDEENILAIDIYQVIRHQLWLDDPDRDKFGYCVGGNNPLLQSGEPAVKCVKIGYSGREETQ